jgi:hypothetical protein
MTVAGGGRRSVTRFRVPALAAVFVTGCALATGQDGAGAAGGDASPDATFRVAVISDLNESYGSTTYRTEVLRAVELIRGEWRPDLVLAAGDLVAGQRPTLSDDDVRAMWAAFDAAIATPLREAGIPFGFALGNHDASAYPAHERDRRLAVEHWRTAGRRTGLLFVDSTHFPLYYSFRQGPLFVVSWDATWEGTLSDEPLMTWLARQLSGEAARSAPFRIVLGHLPLYAVAEGRNRPGEVLAEADSLRALLEAYGVHTYISGHHHAYYPGVRGELDLLHAGALGDGPRPLIGSDVPSPRTVTLLDFAALDGTVAWTTFAIDASGPPRVVRASTLPARIDGFNGWVERRSEVPSRPLPAGR